MRQAAIARPRGQRNATTADRGLEKRLKERVKLRPDYRWLKTVPGIGETLATTIMLETGTITRFARVSN